MQASRIGDLAQSSRVAASATTIQGRIRDAQVQIATGKSASTYAAIARDAGLLVRAKEEQARAAGAAVAATDATNQLQMMDSAVGNVAGIAERFRALLVQRLDAATGSELPVAAQARSMLDEAANQLNVRLDERYLFAGSRSDRPAVSLPTPAPTASDPGAYYGGDEVQAQVRTTDGKTLVYGVTASAAPFAQLISSLGLAAQADASGDRAAMGTALDRLEQAISGLAELRGSIGQNAERLAAVTNERTATADYLKGVVSTIEDTDVPAAATRLAQDQTNLEASYMVTSRLSQLSLADYLR